MELNQPNLGTIYVGAQFRISLVFVHFEIRLKATVMAVGVKNRGYFCIALRRAIGYRP